MELNDLDIAALDRVAEAANGIICVRRLDKMRECAVEGGFAMPHDSEDASAMTQEQRTAAAMELKARANWLRSWAVARAKARNIPFYRADCCQMDRNEAALRESLRASANQAAEFR